MWYVVLLTSLVASRKCDDVTYCWHRDVRDAKQKSSAKPSNFGAKMFLWLQRRKSTFDVFYSQFKHTSPIITVNGKKSCYILQQFTGRKCVAPFGTVLWLHLPIDHFSLTLDGVTSFLSVMNIRNTCKRLRYSQTFGGISSVQWRQVGRILRIQLPFHRPLCVRIEIRWSALVRELLRNNYNIIIIILTLFQEDNIFGTNASLNIRSSDTKTRMRLIIHCLSVSCKQISEAMSYKGNSWEKQKLPKSFVFFICEISLCYSTFWKYACYFINILLYFIKVYIMNCFIYTYYSHSTGWNLRFLPKCYCLNTPVSNRFGSEPYQNIWNPEDHSVWS